MATISEIAHRWANQKFGKNGTLTGKSVYCTDTTFYSYSTPFAQWLDKKRKIMVVLYQAESKSSGKHLSYLTQAIPGGVIVFYTSHRCSNGWNGVDFLDYRGELSDPIKIIDSFISAQYDDLWYITSYKGCNADTSLSHYKEAVRFAQYFPEASINNWLKNTRKRIRFLLGLKNTRDAKKLDNQYRMVKAIQKGKAFTEVFDYVFGKGEWAKYLERSAGARKRAENKKLAGKIARHIGLDRIKRGHMTERQLLALTPLERVNIKLSRWYNDALQDLRSRNKAESKRRMLAYLGIKQQPGSNAIHAIVHPDVNEVLYKFSTSHIYFDAPIGFQDLPCAWLFFGVGEFQHFRQNPAHYRDLLWKKARLYNDIQKGVDIIGIEGIVHPEELEQDGRHEDARCLRLALTRVARRRRREVLKEQIRRRNEDKRLEEAGMTRARIAELRQMGDEGVRQLWRDRLGQLPDTPDRGFFHGGNTLLRFNANKNVIETSKHISLTVQQAEKMWRLVSIWHENPDKFQSVAVPTTSTTWKTDSYVDDILIAGCHRIAYVEMENMARQLGFV